MLINFSFLAVILIVSMLFGRRIKYYTIDCVDHGETFITPILPWLLIFGYIAFLAAMRSNANDTSVYVSSFQQLEGSWQAFWEQVAVAESGKDWAFDAAGILFKMFISDNYHLWFAAFSIIESLAFIYILRRNAVSVFDCCFFFFCSTLYYNYFSMMRQWFAVVLIFAAAGLIAEKKFWKYAIICVIAAQFHNSAYFMIPLYFLVQGKAWSKKQISFISLFSVALLFLNPLLGSLEENLSGTTYDYVVTAMTSGSGSSIIRAFIAAVPVVLAFIDRYEIEDNPMINICVNMSLLNLLLNILASVTSGLYIVRLATYMNVYNMILYPCLLNVSGDRNNRKMLKVLFYIVYLAFYVYQMKYQGAFYYGSDILGVFY